MKRIIGIMMLAVAVAFFSSCSTTSKKADSSSSPPSTPATVKKEMTVQGGLFLEGNQSQFKDEKGEDIFLITREGEAYLNTATVGDNRLIAFGPVEKGDSIIPSGDLYLVENSGNGLYQLKLWTLAKF